MAGSVPLLPPDDHGRVCTGPWEQEEGQRRQEWRRKGACVLPTPTQAARGLPELHSIACRGWGCWGRCQSCFSFCTAFFEAQPPRSACTCCGWASGGQQPCRSHPSLGRPPCLRFKKSWPLAPARRTPRHPSTSRTSREARSTCWLACGAGRRLAAPAVAALGGRRHWKPRPAALTLELPRAAFALQARPPRRAQRVCSQPL